MIARKWHCYNVVAKNIVKTSIQLLYGTWKIANLPEPIVTIFGGTRLSQDDFFAQQAHQLGHDLARTHISVITGGGPGIMQAINCAVTHEEAQALQARTVGITVRGLGQGEEIVNPCVKNIIITEHFFARKWLMINFSVGFAIFPGGFGTLDELTDVVTLIQTKQMKKVPLILIGKNYWQPLLQWFYDVALSNRLVLPEDVALLQVTDDLDEVLCLLIKHCEQIKKKE